MAKKKNNNKDNSNTGNIDKENNNNKNNEEGEKKKNEGGGDVAEKKNKKDEKNSSMTVVLKVDMHCEGCASKIVRCLRSFEGVESVKAETAANKITVVGAVDPSQIRDKLAQKTKKKIDLISPQPKKDKDKDKEESKQENKPKDKSSEDKKPKEAPVTTAALKVGFHCQGCIEKIHKIVSKTKGVLEMSLDKQKELVTVRGTMDVKALTESLKEKLKRPVEIVPPKKEKEKESSGPDNNNNGGGGKKKKNGGGGGGGGDDGRDGDGGEATEGGNSGGGGKVEGNKMEYMGMPGPGYGYGYQMMHPGYYEYGYPVGNLHAPQMFSDENPNSCVVM